MHQSFSSLVPSCVEGVISVHPKFPKPLQKLIHYHQQLANTILRNVEAMHHAAPYLSEFLCPSMKLCRHGMDRRNF